METLNVRAGFLSNHEVLTLLKSQQAARGDDIRILKKRKAARALAEGRTPMSKEREDDEIDRVLPGDLATVTFEAIKYLEAEVHPMRRQTSADVSALLDELEKLELTKAERLQIINLAPTNLVGITICVEDFEMRFPEEKDRLAICELVKKHLRSSNAPLPDEPVVANDAPVAMEEDQVQQEEEYEDQEMYVNEGLAGSGEKESKEIDEE